MASKGASDQAVHQPTVSAFEGAGLLMQQMERARKLLVEQVVTEQAFRTWRIATRQALADALGEGHSMMQMASAAGMPKQVPRNGNVEHAYREALAAGASALEPCVERLRRQAQRDTEREYAESNRGEDPPFVTYDTALICRNGHIVNDAMEFVPADNKKFCSKCGVAAMSACPSCSAAIQGLRRDGSSTHGLFTAPGYCRECGEAFPWTKAQLNSLSQLLAMTDATAEDQAALRDSLPSIAAESPSTPVAIAQWRKFLASAGKQMGELIRGVLVEVASEAVKKKLFP